MLTNEQILKCCTQLISKYNHWKELNAQFFDAYQKVENDGRLDYIRKNKVMPENYLVSGAMGHLPNKWSLKMNSGGSHCTLCYDYDGDFFCKIRAWQPNTDCRPFYRVELLDSGDRLFDYMVMPDFHDEIIFNTQQNFLITAENLASCIKDPCDQARIVRWNRNLDTIIRAVFNCLRNGLDVYNQFIQGWYDEAINRDNDMDNKLMEMFDLGVDASKKFKRYRVQFVEVKED